ncbi:pilus assembly protein PilM [Planctomycetota bacterium]
MPKDNTALGIDISNGTIDIALLEDTGNGIELVKTASCPIPDGVVADGNIENPAMLCKAIKKLKAANKIKSSRSAVSLLAKPMHMQLMYMPKPVPTNMVRFLHNELKQYPLLADKDIVLDFCAVNSINKRDGNRLFVVATDKTKLTELARTCDRYRLNVEAIEPTFFAYTRAFYAEKIETKFDSNVLMAILEETYLTLCVFRNKTIDFIKAKHIDTQSPQCHEMFAEEINAIIQYYNVEVYDSSEKWEVNIVTPNSMQLTRGIEDSLMAAIDCDFVNLRTSDDACQDTMAIKKYLTGTASTVAIGLAMRLLKPESVNFKINLFPDNIAKLKVVKKDALVSINIAAVVLVFMVLAAGALSMMVKNVTGKPDNRKQMRVSESTHDIVEEKKYLDQQVKDISAKLDNINKIISSHTDLDWLGLMDNVRTSTPLKLCITRMYSYNNSAVTIEGNALSYDAVNLFVMMLNDSEHIESASLTKTEVNDSSDKFVEYKINCLPVVKKAKAINVN